MTTVDNRPGTFQLLAENITLALQPLSLAVSDLNSFKNFMFRLGWEVRSLPASYTNLGNLIMDAQITMESLPENAGVVEVLNVFNKVKAVYTSINSITEVPDGVDGQEFREELGSRIFELLLVDYLALKFPRFYKFLQILGIIEIEEHDSTALRPAYNRTRLRFDRLEGIVSNPLSILEMVYGWGTENLNFDLIAGYIHDLFHSLNIPTSVEKVLEEDAAGYVANPEALSKSIDLMIRIPIFRRSINDVPLEGSVCIFELPSEQGKSSGLIIQPSIPPGIGNQVQIDDNTTLNIRPGSDLSSLFGILIRPGDISSRYPFKPDSNLPDDGFGFTIEYMKDEPIIIFGSQQKSRLQFKGLSLSLNIDYNREKSELIFVVENQLRDLLLVISAGEQDSLLSNLLGQNDLEIPIPIAIVWSSKTGFHFKGTPGLSFSINPHLNIGRLKIDQLTFEILSGERVDASPNFAIRLLLTVNGSIGPISFSMDGIGLQFKSVFKDGNAGPLDLNLDVIPPNGIGIVINQNGVKGGGFISKIEGQYSGIVDLNLYGYAIQALAILKTEPFTSFLFAIFANLKTAIQLGAGWKITKIGGMLGVNHTVSHDIIASGIKSGILDTIMFPDNIIANAPTVIRNFNAVFPALHGQNIFGPALRIAYGTPTLITGDVAVILEFPNPFLLSILGKVTSKLPNSENPIVQINIGIVGALDIVNGKVGVYGSIYDSKILDFVISGDMAFAASWGSEKNLILSVGGFNPRFTPPSNFPPFNAPRLKRLNLAFSDLVTFECYLALTSNTLQIGARVDAVFKKSGAVISGFLSFDALVLFNPFHYIIDVEAGFGVKFKGRNLASITFVGVIEGPNPHRIKGSVTFSILWWDFSIHVEKTFGDEILDVISSIDPWDILGETLKQEESWTIETPAWQKMGVITDDDGLLRIPEGSQLIHPNGRFRISQRVVPFNHTLTKFGSVDPKNHFRFQILSVNDIDASHLTKTKDHFAPGQFTQFSTSELLDQPSYELMESGIFSESDTDVQIASDFGALRSKDIEYESVLLENTSNKEDIRRTKLYNLPPLSNVLSQALVVSSRSYYTVFANDSKLKYRPNYRVRDLALSDEKFIIFDEDKNAMVDSVSRGEVSKSIAIDVLKEYKKANPDDKRNLNVISLFEFPELPTTP